MNEYELSEIKRKYEKSMRDVYHMLGEYDHKYIKNYVELLESMVDQIETIIEELDNLKFHIESLKSKEK